MSRRFALSAVLTLVLGACLGYLAGSERTASAASQPGQPPVSEGSTATPPARDNASRNGARLMDDSAAGYDADWERAYPQYQKLGETLQPFPDLKPGMLVPQRLYLYGGPGKSSFGSIDDIASFETFYRECVKMKPTVMAARNEYMALRYNFSGAVDP